ncbi:uncharacterized protein LOC134831286 [Culicoides brevitarsis]|uniref:uncharacterized protein LOC134831286 n=1 Tax=Culicoides brevitarsis TaxID=469753 RepID=UPI00307B2ACB
MEEPQIVYIEEQIIENENLCRASPLKDRKNSLEIILKRLFEMEMKIMDRMDALESCFVKQNQRIDDILVGIFNSEQKVVEEDVVEDVISDELPLVEEISMKRQSENESPDAEILCKRQKPESPLVVESYYEEEALPVACHVVSEDCFAALPFTNFDDVRNFNKSLVHQEASNNFVKYLQRHVRLDDPLMSVSEQIIRLVLSEQILIESTWASKATGKLRISSLENFLKCCLRFGNLYFDNFTLNLVREQTMAMLHELRVENGLASGAVKIAQRSRRKSFGTSITRNDVD